MQPNLAHPVANAQVDLDVHLTQPVSESGYAIVMSTVPVPTSARMDRVKNVEVTTNAQLEVHACLDDVQSECVEKHRNVHLDLHVGNVRMELLVHV